MQRHISALSVWTVNTSLACVAVCCLPAHAQSAPAPVLVIDSSNSGRGQGHTVSAQRWMGPAFHTGAAPTRITALSLALQPAPTAASTPPYTAQAGAPVPHTSDCPHCSAQGQATAQQVTAYLRLYRLDHTTELPVGFKLASASVQVDVQRISHGALTTFGREALGSIGTATLRAFHRYALVVSATDEDRLEILDNRGPANAYLFSGGFSGAATGYLQTLDGGDNWIKDATVTPAIRLVVTPIPCKNLPFGAALPPATVGSPLPQPWMYWPWFMW